MKILLLLIFAFIFTQACEAQSLLPQQMPENVAISFNKNGGMSRSYRRIRIENGNLEFEELKGSQQPPQKWSSAISAKDLAELYRVFVENKFDTIKNDERKGIVNDAGSENIAVSAGANKYFQVTYGLNSQLSGNNLQRYQTIRKALDDFIARHQNKKTDNSSNGNLESREAEERIQGVWRAEGKNGGYGWFLEWTFDHGNFKQTGYPPIFQEGKYRIIGMQGNKLTLELYEQKGNFGEEKRNVEIILNVEKETLKISGTDGFSQTTSKL